MSLMAVIENFRPTITGNEVPPTASEMCLKKKELDENLALVQNKYLTPDFSFILGLPVQVSPLLSIAGQRERQTLRNLGKYKSLSPLYIG